MNYAKIIGNASDVDMICLFDMLVSSADDWMIYECFEKMCSVVGRRMTDSDGYHLNHKEIGAGRLVRELFERTGCDPIAIAANALEDANFHHKAAQIRNLIEEA
jgi:hypothetical protein